MIGFRWKFCILGIEIAWVIERPTKYFITHWESYKLLYIGRLRFWNKKKYWRYVNNVREYYKSLEEK